MTSAKYNLSQVFSKLFRLVSLIHYALHNIDHNYTRKVQELVRKLGVNGFVIVSKHSINEIPKCGLACSIGFGGFGFIFIERNFACSTSFSEELKDFVIAHELAHIVKNHVVPQLIITAILVSFVDMHIESSKSLWRNRSSEDFIRKLIDSILTYVFTYSFSVNVEAKVIKQQELEADDIAINLCGCRGAIMFTELLKAFRLHGYDVSHKTLLGFPALTIDERLRFIYDKCRDNV